MITTGDNNDQRGGGSEEITSNKKECISCEQNNVNNITEDLNSIAILDDTSVCASCGKEGISDNMNTCNKCQSVKYCNAACKKKHRTKHKKACERRVAELHEEALFKEIEPEECPICMLQIPFNDGQSTFKSCCGKTICNGCICAMLEREDLADKLLSHVCPYCRTPLPEDDKEIIRQTKKLMRNGNAKAFDMYAGWYDLGEMGMPQDYQKANELWLKAGELGCAAAYFKLGGSYSRGTGVAIDMKKAKHYYELAAMGGDVKARYNLGCFDGKAGNIQRSLRHFILATRAGDVKALNHVKHGYINGDVTKDEYANTLRAYQTRQDEMKSDERDIAEACYRRLEAEDLLQTMIL